MRDLGQEARRPELKLYQQGDSKRTHSRHNFKAELTEVRDLLDTTDKEESKDN